MSHLLQIIPAGFCIQFLLRSSNLGSYYLHPSHLHFLRSIHLHFPEIFENLFKDLNHYFQIIARFSFAGLTNSNCFIYFCFIENFDSDNCRYHLKYHFQLFLAIHHLFHYWFTAHFFYQLSSLSLLIFHSYSFYFKRLCIQNYY